MDPLSNATVCGDWWGHLPPPPAYPAAPAASGFQLFEGATPTKKPGGGGIQVEAADILMVTAVGFDDIPLTLFGVRHVLAAPHAAPRTAALSVATPPPITRRLCSVVPLLARTHTLRSHDGGAPRCWVCA